MSVKSWGKEGDSSSPPEQKRRPGRRRRRMRQALAIVVTVALMAGIGGVTYSWLSRTQEYKPGEDIPEITRKLDQNLPPGAPEPRFTDVTQEVGLASFRTFQGPRSSQLPEDMGSGAAWGDYDNDGDDDLFLVAAGGSLKIAPHQWAPSLLYENRGGSFVVVKDFPDTRILGMGAAWGDYDADGWLDLVVTGYNRLLLFHNEKGKMVRDTGFSPPAGFWTGATWGDFNNDRRLDLYVCGYVRYVEEEAGKARASEQFGRAVPYTLNPASYQPEENLLFLNLGDGRFREAASELGISNPRGRSLSALWHDLDQDGWLDLYVANDVSDNVLYHFDGAKFTEISHSAWVADYRGAMGLAVGDYNRDGDDDIFVTHWIAQENALYDSLHADLLEKSPEENSTHPATAQKTAGQDGVSGLRFMDLSSPSGLGQPALKMVGWGAEFADFDGDGWLDLVVANGSTFETIDTPPHLKSQKPFLFWNRKGEHFHDLVTANPALNVPHVNRGVALADYDLDGDMDILMVQLDKGVQLLRNDMQKGNWLQVRLRSRFEADSPVF
ncbi:MAG: VCBS repeat-containing protein, partial [Gammaproteobacteria bacterium]|nr:VCBS repeat-containing protein [Gammaproteobacteria bacterium]